MIKKFLVVIIMGVSVNVSAWKWEIMTVDTHYCSGANGVGGALDLLGNPCFVYRRVGEGPIYIRWNPTDSSWIYEFVCDSINFRFGMDFSLTIDSKGYPHISFCGGYSLIYAWKDSLGWHMLDGGGDIYATSIALDTNEFTHIATGVNVPDSFGNWTGLVLHVYYNGNFWTTEIVDTVVAAVGNDVSICVDKWDTVHLAYARVDPDRNRLFRIGDPRFGYARRTSSGWIKEYVDTLPHNQVNGALEVSMRLNSFGHPCIAYIAWGDKGDELRYAEKTDTGWYIVRVDTSTGGSSQHNESQVPTLSLDKNDNPHIVYWNRPVGTQDSAVLKYAWRYNGNWYFDIVDPRLSLSRDGAKPGGYCGFVIDTNGYSHIGYPGEKKRYNEMKMKYARGRADTTGVKNLPTRVKPSIHISPSIGNKRFKIIYGVENESKVNISIYDACGRKISELVNSKRMPGEYVAYWESVVSGVYFCLFKINKQRLVSKFVVIK